jgi:hypothetical protein
MAMGEGAGAHGPRALAIGGVGMHADVPQRPLERGFETAADLGLERAPRIGRPQRGRIDDGARRPASRRCPARAACRRRVLARRERLLASPPSQVLTHLLSYPFIRSSTCRQRAPNAAMNAETPSLPSPKPSRASG